MNNRKLQLISLSWLSGIRNAKLEFNLRIISMHHLYYNYHYQVVWWSPHHTSHPRDSKGEAPLALLEGEE